MSKIKYFAWLLLLKLRIWIGVGQRSDKAILLARLRAERANIDKLVDELVNRRSELQPLQDEWSVKEILAHFAAWD